MAEGVGGTTPSRKREEYWGGYISWVVPSELTDLTSRYRAETRAHIVNEWMTPETPEHVKSGRHLRHLLTTGIGRTIMTTIYMFEEALTIPGESRDALNPSERVVVMVDEAHRTQYGVLGAAMSGALPNAVIIGLTGTPIDKGFRHSTMRRFGSLIDSYTIPQSVGDGATVPILMRQDYWTSPSKGRKSSTSSSMLCSVMSRTSCRPVSGGAMPTRNRLRKPIAASR